ncbi:MAG: formate dehydrogenase subunit gamma [Pseudooceanicola sp.]|nr:formate dehydrogenase subunit gamma [Pseudooceanicola sp.]
MRAILALILVLFTALSATAQDAPTREKPLSPDPVASVRPPENAAVAARPSTGGAQTLEDIMRRQRGDKVDLSFRETATGNPDSAAAIAGQLGTRGAASDAEVFRAIRYGTADVSSSSRGPAAGVLVQDGGMWWLNIRRGILPEYGAYLLGGMLVLLALFFLIRGRIRIEGKKTGITITRFNAFERFGHWLFAGSFLLLGLTGLVTLFGRKLLIPAFGHDTFSGLAIASKWIHNNVAWAFMLGLVIVVINWTIHNIPNRHDLVWLAKGGGLFSKHSHPPAKKFNAGQKIIFWACVVLGVSISASGLSLLFPFEMPMFADTFRHINGLGLPELFGYAPLPEQMAPHEEMQYAQLWHAIVAFVFIAIILAHIYLGTIGMEGAFDAMGTGEVELQWAREHHNLWVEEVQARDGTPPASAHPAE